MIVIPGANITVERLIAEETNRLDPSSGLRRVVRWAPRRVARLRGLAQKYWVMLRRVVVPPVEEGVAPRLLRLAGGDSVLFRGC